MILNKILRKIKGDNKPIDNLHIEYKICVKCKENKSIDHYCSSSRKWCGKEVIWAICNECNDISKRKSQAKRKRELGYNPLNKRFSGCNGHHINNNDVIHIPKSMHRYISHDHNKPDSMIEINKLAWKWLKEHPD